MSHCPHQPRSDPATKGATAGRVGLVGPAPARGPGCGLINPCPAGCESMCFDCSSLSVSTAERLMQEPTFGKCISNTEHRSVMYDSNGQMQNCWERRTSGKSSHACFSLLTLVLSCLPCLFLTRIHFLSLQPERTLPRFVCPLLSLGLEVGTLSHLLSVSAEGCQ